jgi:hypothetical protein
MYKSEARILEVRATISEQKFETKVLGSVGCSTEQCRVDCIFAQGLSLALKVCWIIHVPGMIPELLKDSANLP